MNLFWQRLLGRMMTTTKMEAHLAGLAADYKRYVSVQQSKELAEYRELFHRVKSADFKEKKRTLVHRKYKDTQEYRDITKFHHLTNNKKIILYNQTLQSPLLADYLAFRTSSEYELLSNSAALKKSPDLARLRKFERSKEYKNYIRFHNSYIISELEELAKKVSTDDFKVSTDFWSDSQRWIKTSEYAEEKRFNELAANEDIKFFENTDAKQFEFFAKYTRVFTDSFDWNTLNASRWESGFNYVNDKLIGNHSFTNEKQANNKGENVSVVNGQLHIQTKKEEVTALAWDKKLGFVNHHFDFTSDVIHGTHAVCQEGGVFRAKMRFTGHDLSHAFWLSSKHIIPHINIALCDGKAIEVGVHWTTKFEKKYTASKITGLSVGDYYIYSLEWTKQELIWSINNVEIFRTSDGVPAEALFPMFSSFIANKQKGGEGMLQVDWIEVYSAQ